jgi:hypothetical protein
MRSSAVAGHLAVREYSRSVAKNVSASTERTVYDDHEMAMIAMLVSAQTGYNELSDAIWNWHASLPILLSGSDTPFQSCGRNVAPGL